MGCSSAPYRVEIIDKTVRPNVTLIPTFNTSCSADENFYEGTITVKAYDNSGPGVGSGYTYGWTPTDASNKSVFTVLQQNVASSQRVIAALVRALDSLGPCDCRTSLDSALVTSPRAISDEARCRLEPILRRRLGAAS